MEFLNPRRRADELESLSERIRERRDASLGKGRMSEAPWYGLIRDYMWAVACGVVTNDQVGCSACFGPLPEGERNRQECPYCLSERSVWPVQTGVPAEVLEMYVEAAAWGDRAKRVAVIRSLFGVVALVGFLLFIGVWWLLVLPVLVGGALVAATLGGSAQDLASGPYFIQAWRVFWRHRDSKGEGGNR